LVDDQIHIRSMLLEVLTHLGYEVIVADDSQQALNLLVAERPDIALIDINMPVIDGIKLLKHFKEKIEGMPVILMSGSIDSDTINNAMAAGALAFLTKPFDIFELKKILEDFSSSNQNMKGEEKCQMN
jgi:two-component system response regulator (stage 0 sporulation protein F)